MLTFYVGRTLPENVHTPCGLLVPDSWDDYHYRTAFTLIVYESPGKTDGTTIGAVKILWHDFDDSSELLPRSTRPHLEEQFKSLSPESFCSLGQSSDYYVNLSRLANGLGTEIAWALCDVCVLSATNGPSWYLDAPGFRISLLRYSPAHLARRDGAVLLAGKVPSAHVNNSIPLTEIRGATFEPKGIELRFDGQLDVPGRINVLVGRNGAGKTHLLQHLAKWIGEDKSSSTQYVPRFSRVVIVSNNTFDVPLPGGDIEQGSAVRFVGNANSTPAISRLRRSILSIDPDKWSDEVLRIFPDRETLLGHLVSSGHDTPKALTDLSKSNDWRKFAPQIFEEEELGSRILDAPREVYVELSAGQKALVSLYCQLFVSLDRQGLVLLDEPENFLHPSLTAKFIRNLHDLLDKRQAFAVIATHSPIVLQETPRRFVWVLERTENGSRVEHPSFETFGESIENIDEYLFNTDFRSSHWKRVLKDFVSEGLSDREIEEKVSGLALPVFARAYLERERVRRSSQND